MKLKNVGKIKKVAPLEPNFPIKNAMVRKALDDYKTVLEIKDSVGDHKIIQQRFLSKIKKRQGVMNG